MTDEQTKRLTAYRGDVIGLAEVIGLSPDEAFAVIAGLATEMALALGIPPSTYLDMIRGTPGFQAAARGEARAQGLRVVPAPGDRCGNTKRLEDGSPCPGCRACS